MNIKDDFNFKVIEAKFPKIALGIELRWGSYDLVVYINDLMKDTKGHTRLGFPQEIAVCLTNLLFTHSKEYPNLDEPPDSVWQINYYN